MLPLLAYSVLSAEYLLSDTTDTVISLLALGAKPTDIPQALWARGVFLIKLRRSQAGPRGATQSRRSDLTLGIRKDIVEGR